MGHGQNANSGLLGVDPRDNGYACEEDYLLSRHGKQRDRLPITPELENWILQNIAEAKRISRARFPRP